MCIYIVRFWLTALTECCDEVALHIHVHTHTAHTMYSAHKNTFRHKAEIIIVVCSVLLLIISMYGGAITNNFKHCICCSTPYSSNTILFYKMWNPLTEKILWILWWCCSEAVFYWFVFVVCFLDRAPDLCVLCQITRNLTNWCSKKADLNFAQLY